MTKIRKKNVTVNHVSLNYPHPIFVQIEDEGLEDTLRLYRNNNIPFMDKTMPGGQKRYFAIFNAETEETAKSMNRKLNNMAKKDARDKAKCHAHEISYDTLLDSSYDPADDFNNPEEIVMYKILKEALYKALDELSDEKLRVIKMVANNEPQRQVAEELGISRRTLRERKDSVLDELRKKLKYYR